MIKTVFFAFSLGHIGNKLQEICNVADVRNTVDMLYYICIGQKTIWMGPRTFDHNKTFIEEQIFNLRPRSRFSKLNIFKRNRKRKKCRIVRIG